MQWQSVPISNIKINPDNPRTIRDEKYKQLVKSIKDFPQMLEIRPIVVNADMMVLGGNMRFKACKEAGLKAVPVVIAENLSATEQREFIIKDNVGFGEWDWAKIAAEWDAEDVADWGLDVPNFGLDEIPIPQHDQEEPDLGYDKLIQIKLSNAQFGQIVKEIKEACERVGAEINIS